MKRFVPGNPRTCNALPYVYILFVDPPSRRTGVFVADFISNQIVVGVGPGRVKGPSPATR